MKMYIKHVYWYIPPYTSILYICTGTYSQNSGIPSDTGIIKLLRIPYHKFDIPVLQDAHSIRMYVCTVITWLYWYTARSYSRLNQFDQSDMSQFCTKPKEGSHKQYCPTNSTWASQSGSIHFQSSVSKLCCILETSATFWKLVSIVQINWVTIMSYAVKGLIL